MRIQNSNFSASEEAGFSEYLPDIETGYSNLNLNIPYTLYDNIGTAAVENIWLLNNTFNDGVKLWQNQRIIDNVFIEKNIFSNSETGLQVGGGGYGSHIRDLEISDNLFLSKNGIHLDAYSWGTDDVILIQNNAFIGDGRGFFAGHADSYPADLYIEENLYLDSATAIGNGSYNNTTLAGDIRYNVFLDVEDAIDLPSTNASIYDNAFVDVEGSIYRTVSRTSNFTDNNIYDHSGEITFNTSEDDSYSYSFVGNYLDSQSLSNLNIEDGSSSFTEAVISVSSNSSTPNTPVQTRWSSAFFDADTTAFNQGQTVTADPDLINESYQSGFSDLPME